MKTKILILGLICLFFIFSCDKKIDNPYSPDKEINLDGKNSRSHTALSCPPMIVTSQLSRDSLDVGTIPETPIFTFYPSLNPSAPISDGHSETTFYIVITETIGDGGCIKGEVRTWNIEYPGWWGLYHLSLEPIEEFDTVTYHCIISTKGKPTIMQIYIDGVDWSGRRIIELIDIPFTWTN